MQIIHRSLTLAALLTTTLVLGGCNEQKIAELDKRVASLEKDNTELKKRVAELEQLVRGGRGGVATIPGMPKGLGGLAKMLQGLTGGSGTVRVRGGRPTMNPDLQKRMDKLVVDSLEKLAKSKDAKELVKSMLKAMRRDFDRKKSAAEKTPAKPNPSAQ
jgi:outer membrane murein-binding lipoprotein Lpp